MSDKHKRAISKAHKGKEKSTEHKIKLSIAKQGQSLKDSTKIKISNKMKGKINHSSKQINIFDANNNLVEQCHGNFKMFCINNDLPFASLKNTYLNNTMLYTSIPVPSLCLMNKNNNLPDRAESIVLQGGVIHTIISDTKVGMPE